jgi:hypothetical protein
MFKQLIEGIKALFFVKEKQCVVEPKPIAESALSFAAYVRTKKPEIEVDLTDADFTVYKIRPAEDILVVVKDYSPLSPNVRVNDLVIFHGEDARIVLEAVKDVQCEQYLARMETQRNQQEIEKQSVLKQLSKLY